MPDEASHVVHLALAALRVPPVSLFHNLTIVLLSPLFYILPAAIVAVVPHSLYSPLPAIAVVRLQPYFLTTHNESSYPRRSFNRRDYCTSL
jgi:hypothetical protein